MTENQFRWTEVEGGLFHKLIEAEEQSPSPSRFLHEIASR